MPEVPDDGQARRIMANRRKGKTDGAPALGAD